MRVGIIGGGAAGLTTAWLLDGHHDVTLFEADDRLGGHAHTVTVEAAGQSVDVDAGFEFFAPGAGYATFNRLLDALDVQREPYPATLTVYRHGADQRPVVMPPFRNGRPVWPSFTPRALGDLIRFRRFLTGIPDFLGHHDKTITIADYIDSQRLSKRFTERFLYPLLLAFWCVEPAEFRGFAAYNALYYLGANLPKGLRPPTQSRIRGGLRTYIDALEDGLDHVEVRLGTAVVRVERDGEQITVTDARGIRSSLDRVVLATNARQARGLLEAMPELERTRDQLARFEYFDTTIAIHGDRRLMPRDESAWSIVNARSDGAHSSLSIWNPDRPLPIFKSWVTYDERMPEPLYALVTYQHGKITPAYFDAQRRLKPLQGSHGIWLAGLYADDADSHESAIRSAVTVAEALAPGTTRLVQLSR